MARRRSGFVENLAALYGVQAASYLLPLVTVPYLARVLGPAPLGVVAMAQALALYVTLIVEFGFHLSATREVARGRDDPRRLADLLAWVPGARVVVSLALLPVPLLVARFVGPLADAPGLVWAAYLAGVAQGLAPAWFFQGMERMRQIALMDAGARLCATVGIFLLVRTPRDASLVLWLQAAGGALATAWGFVVAAGEVRMRVPSPADAWAGLRLGWSMFVYRTAVSLYTAGNAFILGLLVPPSLVGYYAGAEKIVRALQGLLSPLSQTLYPRVSFLARRSRDDAARLALAALAAMSALGSALGLAAFGGAPVLVAVLLGDRFAPAVPVLRLLAAILPLVAASNVLGIQWMLPLGLDRPFTRIIVAAGAVNVGLAVVLAPRGGALGMAAAVVASEVLVTVAMLTYLRLRRLDPLAVRPAAARAS